MRLTALANSGVVAIGMKMAAKMVITVTIENLVSAARIRFNAEDL